MTIKTSMFSNGTVIVHEAEGKVRKATAEEISQHLASFFPTEKQGKKLTAVKYDPETGYAYGKFEDKTYRKLVAQSKGTTTTEPTNSVDKADPKVDVPRSKEKAKPQIDVGRPDVNSPKEVRKDNYERGKGGEDLHTDVVPRSKGNSGLSGSKATTFEDETANKAKSGNPDTYVQTFTPSEKPASAGSADNHTASTGISIRPDSEIYQKLSINKIAKDEGDDDKEDGKKGNLPPWLKKDKEENKDEKKDGKDEKSDGKKGNLPPWLQKGKKDDDKKDDGDKKDDEKENKFAEATKQLTLAQKENSELKAELNRYKIREERVRSASAYVLALRDLNPVKYASAEVFNQKVEDTAKKMNIEAIETAIEELDVMRQEASVAQQAFIKQASKQTHESGLATAIVIQKEEGFGDSGSSLKDILMSGTSLGKKMAEFDSYVPHQKD